MILSLCKVGVLHEHELLLNKLARTCRRGNGLLENVRVLFETCKDSMTRAGQL